MLKSIGNLNTESRNPRTIDLDKLNTLDMVKRIITEENGVMPAIFEASEELARAVDLYAKTLKSPGRIIVAGSGCSGDYAFLDVAELATTFNQQASGDRINDKVMALHIQRGYYHNTAIDEYNKRWLKEIQKRDMSEDSLTQPQTDLELIKFGEQDLLIVISASGRSPALVELARLAQQKNGKVIAIVMNRNARIKKHSNITIEAVTPPPPLTGSGRMLAGSASKIIMTTLSTAAHVKTGAVHSNLMVNLNIKDFLDNSKFVDRGIRIVATITGASFKAAKKTLRQANWNIKVACVMIIKNTRSKEAEAILLKSEMVLRKALL